MLSECSPAITPDLGLVILSDGHLNTLLSRCYGDNKRRESQSHRARSIGYTQVKYTTNARLNLPNLYFSFASARSLASKYQTVMA